MNANDPYQVFLIWSHRSGCFCNVFLNYHPNFQSPLPLSLTDESPALQLPKGTWAQPGTVTRYGQSNKWDWRLSFFELPAFLQGCHSATLPFLHEKNELSGSWICRSCSGTVPGVSSLQWSYFARFLILHLANLGISQLCTAVAGFVCIGFLTLRCSWAGLMF